MKAAIYNGVFAIGNEAQHGVDHTCRTGNCTWPEFSSLAVCSQCEDITSLIRKDRDNKGGYILSLPNGPSLSGLLGGQINSSVTNISSTLDMIQASVFRFSSLVSRRVNHSDDAFAIECAMWYCVQSYKTYVEDSVFYQKILSSWRNDSATLALRSDLFYDVPTTERPTVASNSTYRVAFLAAEALNSFMSNTFTGSGGLNKTGSAFSSDVQQALYNTMNIPARINNLAIAMTNNMRQQNDSLDNPIHGITWKSETYVHVRWAWFSYPAAVAVLAVIFLIGSIIETAHREILVWKGSNLALLFHGRDIDLTNPPLVKVNKLSRMSDIARNVQIKLVQTLDKDWKLVQR